MCFCLHLRSCQWLFFASLGLNPRFLESGHFGFLESLAARLILIPRSRRRSWASQRQKRQWIGKRGGDCLSRSTLVLPLLGSRKGTRLLSGMHYELKEQHQGRITTHNRNRGNCNRRITKNELPIYSTGSLMRVTSEFPTASSLSASSCWSR